MVLDSIVVVLAYVILKLEFHYCKFWLICMQLRTLETLAVCIGHSNEGEKTHESNKLGIATRNIDD